jgi:sn-glycerol 3-phosphate transport system ATP-binding protein/multiple sugar transport system ATP-binding protein
MSQSPATREAKGASAREDTPAPVVQPKPLRCAARGVKKSFGATQVLKGVDLEIPEGSFAVLVGSSGCGKSTLLRVVAGLEQVDEGTVELAGKDVTSLPPRDRDIAMVFQSYALYPHLSVRDNLAFGLRLRKVPDAEIASRVREASDMLGLEKLLDRLPKQLSGGQRQRVAMGRAIVRRPNVFLFDEPLSNLDAALRAEVRVDIRRLHDRLGATTLYVTHDQVEAMTLADTLWVMNAGLVEQKGPPLAVYERPRTRFVATFLGSPQMNLVRAKLEKDGGRWLARGDDLVAVLEGERFGAELVEGREVELGVRPHDLLAIAPGDAAYRGPTATSNSARPTTPLKIELVEALGFEAYAHGWVRAAGPKLVLRLDGDAARSVRAGDTVAIGADPERVHLFDPKTGLSLDRGSSDPGQTAR